MNDKIYPTKLSGLSATLLIPLWAKAIEYDRPEALLEDLEAVRMMKLIDYDFDKFSSAKLSQIGCCGRARLIDNETRRFIERYPDAVVLQLGAGLDARFERLGRPNVTWFDLDLPEVIAIRRQLLPESKNRYLATSLFNESWMRFVAELHKPVLLLLEGVLMYFPEAEVKAFFAAVARHLPRATVVFDILPPAAVGKSKYHDALKKMNNEARPEFKWALEDVKTMLSWQPNLRLGEVFYLSQHVGKRYPWWVRLLYLSTCGRRKYDMRIARLELG